MIKPTPIPVIISIVLFAIAGIWGVNQVFPSKPTDISNPVLATIVENRQAELTLIKMDLDEYSTLSVRTRLKILTAIDSSSIEFGVPVALLHAIFQIESDYHFNIDHPTVIVTIKGKQIKTSCKGLGGILWENWCDSLKTYGIAETVSDLYIPEINIRASAFILRVIINDELKKSSDRWIISRIIRQYYGKYNPAYEAQMQQVTSKLWLKRIGREVLEPWKAKIDIVKILNSNMVE